MGVKVGMLTGLDFCSFRYTSVKYHFRKNLGNLREKQVDHMLMMVEQYDIMVETV